MAWIEFNDASHLNANSAPELESLRDAATGEGQADPVEAIAAAVVDAIRGSVAVKNTLGPDGTIPQELLLCAMSIFRFEATLRLPGVQMLQDDSRRKAYDSAQALLRRVEDGKFAVSAPDPDEENEEAMGGAPAPDVGEIREDFSRDKFDGT